MNSTPDVWYNELYRIMADGTLLTQTQTLKLGECLRAIQAGENAEYHLNDLYFSIKSNNRTEQEKKVLEILDDFIHAYIKYQEEVQENDKDTEDSEHNEWVDIKVTQRR